MNSGDIEALIQRGEPIAGQIVPARDGEPEKVGGNARRDRHNEVFYDHERAAVCLNCPLPDCEGTRRCFKRMKDNPAAAIQAAEERQSQNTQPPDIASVVRDFGESLDTFFAMLDSLLHDL